MLRKILVLVAVGLLALCASIVAAFFLWRTPAGRGEGEAKGHEAIAPVEIAKPEAEGASTTHSDRPGETGAHAEATPTTIHSGPAFEVAQAALGSLSPEDGLKQLEAALALPHNQEQGALLHEARGELYAQRSPPDFVQSQAAFEQALELSSDTLLEEEIRYKAVQMLVQSGNDAEALKVAAAQFVVSPPTGVPGFKLKLLLGQLQERAGDAEQAEKSYRSVLDAVETLHGQMGREVADPLARLAALRLTQCYRSHGREKEIEDVTALLKKLLAQMQEASN